MSAPACEVQVRPSSFQGVVHHPFVPSWRSSRICSLLRKKSCRTLPPGGWLKVMRLNESSLHSSDHKRNSRGVSLLRKAMCHSFLPRCDICVGRELPQFTGARDAIIDGFAGREGKSFANLPGEDGVKTVLSRGPSPFIWTNFCEDFVTSCKMLARCKEGYS